jgi:hypothetical protein
MWKGKKMVCEIGQKKKPNLIFPVKLANHQKTVVAKVLFVLPIFHYYFFLGKQ